MNFKITSMTNVATASLVFLALGTLTSVSILSGYQILFSIALLGYSYRAFQEKQFKLPLSAYFLLAFFTYAFFTTSFNFDIIPKPVKNFGRLKYFLFGIFGIIFFKYWLKEAQDLAKKIFLNAFLLSIVVTGIWAIIQFFILGHYRAEGFTHTLRYGYGSGMILLILLGAIFHYQKLSRWFNYKLAIAAFVIGFIAFFVTYTRGALLGFLCGLPFALYFYKPKLGFTFGSVAVLCVLSLGGFYLFGSGNYKNRFLVNKNNYADVIRRSQWLAAIKATEERPITGWGLSNFHSQLKRIKNQYDLDAKEYDDAHSHNLFLEVSSGTGLIGLFFFLGWLLMWAIECFRAKGLVRALTIPFGVGFIVSSQFEVTFDANNATMIFTVYSLSACVAMSLINDKALRA